MIKIICAIIFCLLLTGCVDTKQSSTLNSSSKPAIATPSSITTDGGITTHESIANDLCSYPFAEWQERLSSKYSNIPSDFDEFALSLTDTKMESIAASATYKQLTNDWERGIFINHLVNEYCMANLYSERVERSYYKVDMDKKMLFEHRLNIFMAKRTDSQDTINQQLIEEQEKTRKTVNGWGIAWLLLG